MAATREGTESSLGEGSPDSEGASVGLRAHATSPGKTVLTEPDNSDGWIATDVLVDVER